MHINNIIPILNNHVINPISKIIQEYMGIEAEDLLEIFCDNKYKSIKLWHDDAEDFTEDNIMRITSIDVRLIINNKVIVIIQERNAGCTYTTTLDHINDTCHDLYKNIQCERKFFEHSIYDKIQDILNQNDIIVYSYHIRLMFPINAKEIIDKIKNDGITYVKYNEKKCNLDDFFCVPYKYKIKNLSTMFQIILKN
jgi:hypothetical protein